MKEKMIEHALLLFLASFITIFTIVVSHSSMVGEVTPAPFRTVLFAGLYLLVWLGLILFSIRRYYSMLLLVFGLFWLSSFIILIFLMLSTLLHNDPTGIILSLRSWFYAPLYGLNRFFSPAVSSAVGAGVSIIFGLTALLCVPRKSHDLSRKEYRNLRRKHKG